MFLPDSRDRIVDTRLIDSDSDALCSSNLKQSVRQTDRERLHLAEEEKGEEVEVSGSNRVVENWKFLYLEAEVYILPHSLYKSIIG